MVDRQHLTSIETQLLRIHAVVKAGVRAAHDGTLEVHALSTESAGPLRPKIRSALIAGFGIDLPLEQIHVVEIAAAPESSGERILFHSVNVYREGNRAEAQVELRRDGVSFVGTADGPAIRHALPRLVARATLGALRSILGDDLALELLALEPRRLGGRRLMLAHLVVLRGREETHLTGSVLVTQDPLESVVFSLLDALNRVWPMLEGEIVEFEVEPLFGGSHG